MQEKIKLKLTLTLLLTLTLNPQSTKLQSERNWIRYLNTDTKWRLSSGQKSIASAGCIDTLLLKLFKVVQFIQSTLIRKCTPSLSFIYNLYNVASTDTATNVVEFSDVTAPYVYASVY